MGTSGTIEAPLPQKPAAVSAPPSVRSDREAGAERPAYRRPRSQRKSRPSPFANDFGDRPGSAPHVPSVGVATGWPRDGQQPQTMNFGMPYAFHIVENGVEQHATATAVAMPNGTHEYFSLAPVLIHHSGHGMVPYLTWDFSGYTAAATASYGAKPPQHRQHQQQQYSNGLSRNNSKQHRNGRKNGYNDSSVVNAANSGLSSGTGMRRSVSTVSLASFGGSDSGSLRGGASVATTSVGGASSDVASLRSAPGSPRSDRRRRHQHQRKFSTASIESLPAVADGSDDAPDLERFLKASTPCVRLPSGAAAVADLRLSDLWKFFEQSSVFGLECAALGGPRGPSSCYFVPYLSAVHLYTPTGGEDDDATSSNCSTTSSSSSLGEEEVFSFPQGLDSWPTGMKRGFSWSAAEHVADRLPLHTRVTELATRDGTALEEHPLWSSRMVDLHPYSWFAVAWYPLYRIPDAPLTARFLTFHSMAPLWEAATAAERELKETAAATAAADKGGASAASYKLMLKAGGISTSGGGGETPTGLANAYPGSPFASEGTHSAASGPNSTATATAHCGCGTSEPSRSRPQSVASGSDPATAGSDTASLNRSFGSLTHSPATSDAGDGPLLPAGSSSSIGGGTGNGRRKGAGGSSLVGTSTLSCPAVGLCWHTAGSAAGENWTDTLVAVDVPEDAFGRGLRLGDVLPGSANASVAGVWPRTAVIRKDYPLAKGGPLSWEIQLEELEEGARRLALRQGLVKIKPGAGGAVGQTNNIAEEEEEEEEEPENCCPDYDFFSSRRR